jgi:preprotein translocase subunit SecG
MMFELALFGVNPFVSFLLGTALLLVTLFLILLILVQRGKGGGLAGALGGMGGESALGTRAGDVFTKITVGTALIWILLCMLTYKIYEPPKLPETADPRGSVTGTEEGASDTTDSSTTPGGSTEDVSDDNAPFSNPATDSPFDGLGGGATDSTPDNSGTDDSESSPEGGSSDSTPSESETPDDTSGEENSDQ